MSDDDEGISNFTDAAAYSAISTIVLATTGAPVPPTLIRNTLKAAAALITGALKIPAAALDAKVQAIKDRSAAQSLVTAAEARAQAAVTAAAGRAAAKRFGKDEELGERAANFWSVRVLDEQKNREAVTKLAVAQLGTGSKDTPPGSEQEPPEIEDDWLNLFARHAETKTNEEMRAYFGRVLAGEIRKPGSFSPATIEVLARLTPTSAGLFLRFCNISGHLLNDAQARVLAVPFGQPGSNALAPLGFNYETITRLQDAGLVRSDLTAYMGMSPFFLTMVPYLLAGKKLIRLRTDLPSEEIAQKLNAQQNLSVINFTQAGQELRSIANMTPDVRYELKFLEWAKGLGMVPVDGS